MLIIVLLVLSKVLRGLVKIFHDNTHIQLATSRHGHSNDILYSDLYDENQESITEIAVD